MNWAWEQELAPTPKLILMALADAANDRDECWPGVPFLARKCCVSERTVQRVLQDFHASNLMSIEPRFDAKNGRRIQNRYHLNINVRAAPDKLSPSTATIEKAGDRLSGTMVTGPVTYAGDIAESPLKSQHESKQQPPQLPRSLSSIERQAIASLVEKIPEEQAQALIDELEDAIETASIRTSAVRWFRGLISRYNKGEFVPVGGLRIATRRARAKERMESCAPGPKLTDQEAARKSLAHLKDLVKQPRIDASVPTYTKTAANVG